MKNRSVFLPLAVVLLATLAVVASFDAHASVTLMHGFAPGGWLSLAIVPAAVDPQAIVDAVKGMKDAMGQRLDKIEQSHAELQSATLDALQKAARTGGRGAGADEAENVGALVAKHEGMASLRDGSMKNLRIGIKSLGQKAAVTNSTYTAGATTVLHDMETYGPLSRRLTIRDLMEVRPTTAASIEFVPSTRTGTAAIQALEGDTKAELALGFTLVTSQVRTIAAWLPASRQVLDDANMLEDFINNQLRDALTLTEEAQILSGDGTGSNLNGLITQASAYTRGKAGDRSSDTLRRAITQVQLARGVANGIVVSPAALEDMEVSKDADGNYMTDFKVFDSNGRATVWRVPTLVTDAMTGGTFLVGDFARAARLYDRMQAAVEIGTQHADYFIRNLVAVLAESRLALTVPRPALLVTGTLPGTFT